MLREEKEKNLETVRVLREKQAEQRLEMEKNLDDMRNSLSEKEDLVRRLQFEVEKA